MPKCTMEHLWGMGGDTVPCTNEAAYHSARLDMYYCAVCHKHLEEEDCLEKDDQRIAKGTIKDCEHCVWESKEAEAARRALARDTHPAGLQGSPQAARR